MKPTTVVAFLAVIISLSSEQMTTVTQQCRDRLGYFSPENFKISTCSLCYFYMIKEHPVLVLDKPLAFKEFHTTPFHLVKNSSVTQSAVHLFPSLDNRTSMELVCDTMGGKSCNRWKSCCATAWNCCLSQIKYTLPLDVDAMQYCPQTFDGWLCWNFTRAGLTPSQPCPNFLSTTEVSGKGVKFCNPDGTWFTDNQTGLEYTNYDSCQQKEENNIYQKTVIVGVVFNSIGIFLVVPAILVFTCNRGLRKQQRIQIHINFFVSILISSSVDLLWDIDVRLDRLTSTQNESTLYGNQSYCKTLHVLLKWSRSSTFFWMTCEGYFLHRLLMHAFIPPKRFYGYLLFGWALPTALMITYSITRISAANNSVCWLLPLQDTSRVVEWVLVYVPSILCIFVNIFFLISILKQLLTKMVSHPNEPSTFRKAVRATFILIPLFGLHQFCLIYRPSPDQNTAFSVYEFVATIIMNSNGIVISLIFCYFNNEVKGYIRNGLVRLKIKFTNTRQHDNRNMSTSTKSDSRKTSISSMQVQPTHLCHNSAMNGIVNNGFDALDRIEITSL